MDQTKPSLLTRLITAGLALAMLAGLFGAAAPAAAAAMPPAVAAATAGLSIVSVKAGKSVTIQVAAMPANTVYQVRMNTIGTLGVGGTLVGTAKTNGSGTFTATFAIPESLKSLDKIAIRAEAQAHADWFVYNWFNNVSSSTSGSTTGSSSSSTDANSIPAGTYSAGNLTVDAVEEDKEVSISLTNGPANTLLTAYVDWQNRSGTLLGKKVGTVRTDKNGAAEATFTLPAAASDRPELRIRLQFGTFLAYKWFLNAESDEYTGSSADPDYTGGIPYILVTGVEAGDTVSIDAINFPKGDYEVLIGKLSGKGKNGTVVDTIKIKKDTTFSGSFDIPDDLDDRDELAIRVQSVDDSSLFAYTWFEN